MLFWWILTGLVALALLPTIWTALDVGAAGLFIGPGGAKDIAHWWWVELINLYIPAVFRVIVLVALVAWIWASMRPSAKQWRLPLAFLALAVTLGPGLLVNEWDSRTTGSAPAPTRSRPLAARSNSPRAAVMADQCNNNCSFVSGHVACGFFLASLMLVDRRRRIGWGIAGIGAGLVIGFARMADGAHWLSDVLWAGPITLLCSWLVWELLLRLYRE